MLRLFAECVCIASFVRMMFHDLFFKCLLYFVLRDIGSHLGFIIIHTILYNDSYQKSSPNVLFNVLGKCYFGNLFAESSVQTKPCRTDTNFNTNQSRLFHCKIWAVPYTKLRICKVICDVCCNKHSWENSPTVYCSCKMINLA